MVVTHIFFLFFSLMGYSLLLNKMVLIRNKKPVLMRFPPVSILFFSNFFKSCHIYANSFLCSFFVDIQTFSYFYIGRKILARNKSFFFFSQKKTNVKNLTRSVKVKTKVKVLFSQNSKSKDTAKKK